LYSFIRTNLLEINSVFVGRQLWVNLPFLFCSINLIVSTTTLSNRMAAHELPLGDTSGQWVLWADSVNWLDLRSSGDDMHKLGKW